MNTANNAAAGESADGFSSRLSTTRSDTLQLPSTSKLLNATQTDKFNACTPSAMELETELSSTNDVLNAILGLSDDDDDFMESCVMSNDVPRSTRYQSDSDAEDTASCDLKTADSKTAHNFLSNLLFDDDDGESQDDDVLNKFF